MIDEPSKQGLITAAQTIRFPGAHKRLKVGIIDLVERQPRKSPYARIVNPNYISIVPQFVAVWAEQLGHTVTYLTYTGFEDLYRELPADIDILFICSFTQASYTAYAISNMYRQKGVVTVLGGPHARAYANDARRYFDYVLGLTDKELIRDLLSDFSPQPEEGVLLSAAKQLTSVPTIQERWKYAHANLQKTFLVHVVPMVGSLGCPYTCSFCIDSQIEYQTLPFDQIREDLIFLRNQPKPSIVSWYDPNFGVRFNEYLDVIQAADPEHKLRFAAESSLSLLNEPNMKRLKESRFIVMVPGIESWFAYNNKSKAQSTFGLEKVKAVAEQLNMIARYVPYIQANFIFGTDTDQGTPPFELTKHFVDLAPGIFPNYSLITSFGDSAPLNHQYQAENRVLDIPFPFLDGSFGLNVRPKNYSHIDFYGHVIDLMKYSFSARMTKNRFKANKHPFPRWMNLLRTYASSRGTGSNFGEIRDRLITDREFQSFYAGETTKPPAYYRDKIRSTMGVFYDFLPKRIIHQLEHGEEVPNPRIFKTVPMEASAPAQVQQLT